MEALNTYTRYYQYRRRFEPTSTNSAAGRCHHLDFGPPAQLASPITDAWGAKAGNCLLGGNRALALTSALPAHRGNAIITGEDVRTDQSEVRIRVVREHDPQRIEQNVNTFFRSEPTDIEELFRLRPEAGRPGELREIDPAIDMDVSLCERRKAPPHTRGDEVAVG